MTTIKDTLRADLATNLKARNELETSVLRAVLGEVQSQEKAGKTAVEFDDAKVLEVLGKLVKQRRESATIYTDAGATDRATRETAEADFLAKYLPVQLTDEEVEAYVDAAIATFDAPAMKDFGAIMKVVVAATKGRADGKVVSALVKAKIA